MYLYLLNTKYSHGQKYILYIYILSAKWFLKLCSLIGLAYDLNQFSDNEIKRGILDMRQKKLLQEKQSVDYGVNIATLPIWTMDEYQTELSLNNDNNNYVIFNDVVHSIPNEFILKHPGGPNMIKSRIGKDITNVFNGDIYNHSNAARNILSHYRIARIHRSKK